MKVETARMLVAARKAKGLTQKQLAKKMGIVQPAVARAESGKCLGIDFLQKAAKAYKAKIIPPRFDFLDEDF